MSPVRSWLDGSISVQFSKNAQLANQSREIVYCDAMPRANRAPNLTKAGVKFILTELETGLTLAQIALDSEDKAKTRRNHKNARLAYDTAKRNIDRVMLTDSESQQISRLVRELRRQLQRLGDKFEEPDSSWP